MAIPRRRYGIMPVVINSVCCLFIVDLKKWMSLRNSTIFRVFLRLLFFFPFLLLVPPVIIAVLLQRGGGIRRRVKHYIIYKYIIHTDTRTAHVYVSYTDLETNGELVRFKRHHCHLTKKSTKRNFFFSLSFF